jgi:hypothetical protein
VLGAPDACREKVEPAVPLPQRDPGKEYRRLPGGRRRRPGARRVLARWSKCCGRVSTGTPCRRRAVLPRLCGVQQSDGNSDSNLRTRPRLTGGGASSGCGWSRPQRVSCRSGATTDAWLWGCVFHGCGGACAMPLRTNTRAGLYAPEARACIWLSVRRARHRYLSDGSHQHRSASRRRLR